MSRHMSHRRTFDALAPPGRSEMMSGGYPGRDTHTEAQHPRRWMDALLLAHCQTFDNRVRPSRRFDPAHVAFPVVEKILVGSCMRSFESVEPLHQHKHSFCI